MGDKSNPGGPPVLTKRDLDDLETWHRGLLAIVALISAETEQPVSEIIADALEGSPLIKAYRLGGRLGVSESAAVQELAERCPF